MKNRNSWFLCSVVLCACQAQNVSFDTEFAIDNTGELRRLIRDHCGGTLLLEPGRVYTVREKLQLNSLCSDGIVIDGRGATIQAAPEFRHPVLLTATNVFGDPAWGPSVIRDLTIDAAGATSRGVFGRWKETLFDRVTLRGATTYQANAIFEDSTLMHLNVIGNPDQTDNGFDCNLQNSVMWWPVVNMHGNRSESALWLNGSYNAYVMYPTLTDGRSAFGLENSRRVLLWGPVIRGEFTFRVVNILAAAPSEDIWLVFPNIDTTHVGSDPAAAIHFNQTIRGLVYGGQIKSPSVGVLINNADSAVVRKTVIDAATGVLLERGAQNTLLREVDIDAEVAVHMTDADGLEVYESDFHGTTGFEFASQARNAFISEAQVKATFGARLFGNARGIDVEHSEFDTTVPVSPATAWETTASGWRSKLR